ncbi:uncharacterized protein LOC122508427 [Leptopilina heterotoma]|uniref:uncharacterized protein LOC122508427 n=1 Tax=Leptopilina heterotoma TaxID=63436 RepID=UPI001CA99E1A|nr:uncharacterized protein LOC122508427 [Leptopilina heterotoma]
MESSAPDYEAIDIKEEIPSDVEDNEVYDNLMLNLMSAKKEGTESFIKIEEQYQETNPDQTRLSRSLSRAARRYVKEKQIEDVRKKIYSGLYALEQKSGGRSEAWKRFQVIIEVATGLKTEYVQCKICEFIQKYVGTSTGTSQLLRHSCIKRNNETTNPNQHCLSMIIKSCIDFCAIDLQPLTVIKGTGFQKLAQDLINIGAKLGPTSIKDLMPDQNTLYVQLSQEVQFARQESFLTILPIIQKEEGAISLNTWIDNNTGHSYTNVVYHHINDKWEFNSSLMFTVFNNKNDKNYSEILDEIIQKFIRLGASWKIMKPITIISEQSIDDQDYNQIPCVEVSLNTIIKIVLYSKFTEIETPEIHHILSGLDNFVKFMNQSGLFARIKKLRMRIDKNETWQEHLQSLTVIHQHNNQIIKLVNGTDQWLLELDITIVEFLMNFLQLFSEAIKDLLDDNKPNIHLVLLWYKKIINFCAKKTDDKMAIKLIKSRTIEKLKELYPIDHRHKVATFLWSSVRKMKMLSNLDRVQFMQQLQTELNQIDTVVAQEEEKDPLADSGPPEKRRKQHFHQWLENQDDDEKSDEIFNYLMTRHCNNSDLLMWWKLKEGKFPKLASLAKKYLCIPATKRHSEKFFEPAKILLNNRSADMKPSTVIDLNYMHYFYKSI